jgi:hypothetical protein
MNAVAPDVDHSEVANAIAHVVDMQQYTHDDDARRQVAALLVAVAFREGSLRTRVEGDFDKRGRPHSFCTMQIHDRSGGTPALNDDLELCITTGLQMLRTSSRICPTHPIAFYAEGPAGCTSRRAQRISNDRMALARWVARVAREALAANEPAAEPPRSHEGATSSERDATAVRALAAGPPLTRRRTEEGRETRDEHARARATAALASIPPFSIRPSIFATIAP